MDSIKMGAGMSIGQRLVSGVFGPPSVATVAAAPVTAAPSKESCDVYRIALDTCLKRVNPYEGCDPSLTLYKECLERNQ
jgi:hypothetical protein